MNRTAIRTSGFLYRLKKFSMAAYEEGRLWAEAASPPPPTFLFDRDLPQQFKVAEHLARAQHDAGQRIVRDRHGQARFLANALVQVFQHGAAAGENDAPVADVGAECRRSTLQGHADRI